MARYGDVAARPPVIRTEFDFRTPTWTAYGRVVFSADVADRDQQIARIAGAGAVVTITAEREATSQEIEQHRTYRTWLDDWTAAAKVAKAGRHMANPPTRRPA